MAKIRLGSNLKAILKSRGIGLKELSRQTGIPYSTLHTWLSDRQPKDILKVKALADFLGMNLDVLLFGDEQCDAIKQILDLPGSDDILGVYEVIVRRRG